VNTRRPPAPPPSRRPASSSPLKRWAPAIAAAGVLAVVVFAGFSGSDGPSSAAPGVNPGSVDASLTVPGSSSPPVVVVTDPGTTKTQLTSSLRRGNTGPQVKAMQQRLKEFGFDPGPIDGVFGSGTEQALWAFEGLVLKKPYDQQSGELTNATWQLMQDPITFGPRRPLGVGHTHMEIYLDLQAAAVFTDDKPTLITHISSGTGQTWCEIITQDTDETGLLLPEPVKKDVCGVSKTPGGVFQFYRRVDGNRQGPLGGMFNPVYFNFGIAVHGAHNVPDAPASHGCIRLPMYISEYFPSLVKNKDYVYVWDGKKEPEQQSKKEMLPVFNYRNPDATTTTSSTTTTSTTVKPTTTPKPAPPTTPKPTPTTAKTTTTVPSGTTTSTT
jgi:lipoprotein-anchoring transpeptidase ErfK/SrfK